MNGQWRQLENGGLPIGNPGDRVCETRLSSLPMKRVFALSSVAVCLLFTLACKKDTNNFQPFSPVGFWRGNLTNEASIAMLNLPDSTSSFYAMLNSLDTAVAEEKFYGHYAVKNGVMKAVVTMPPGNGFVYDSLTLETITANPQSMTGILIINIRYTDTTGGTQTPSFNLVKQ